MGSPGVSSIATGSRRPDKPTATPRTTPPAPAGEGYRSTLALALPLALAAALAAIGLLPSVRQHAALASSMWGAAGFIALWTGLYSYIAGPRRRAVGLQVVLRKQHYLQACAQLSVYLYWGWYWREVYHSAHLIAAQILFAYAFDVLLAWSRGGKYVLGFGPFPIIFSINLFLWFKPDWFYLQFLMVAVGFLAKAFITWEKDGQRAHIFNPSSFPLGLFSLGLLLTGTTGITWGQEIAQTFEWPPYIRLWIFVIGLPGQFLFGVTTMTMSAVLAVFGFGLGYYSIFGTYYFVDAFMPAAVFLGMHLLFTDPSTAPRSELGRILYGVIYGLGVVALYGLLGLFGAPTFYDKLLAVPLMNMAIQLIDAAARSSLLRPFDPARLGRSLSPRQRNLAYMSVWAVAFVIVSDPTASYRPRRWLPFWEQACVEDRRNACLVLSKLEAQYCKQGSGWACNELGILEATGRAKEIIPPQAAFAAACSRGAMAGCANRGVLQAGATPLGAQAYQRSQPQPADYPLLLQEGQGPLDALTAVELYDRACQQGWADGCNRLASLYSLGTGMARDVPRAIAALERACSLKSWQACADLGVIFQQGDGVASDVEKGRSYLQRACDGGLRQACDRLEGRSPGSAGG
jgi:TPR repeat protein